MDANVVSILVQILHYNLGGVLGIRWKTERGVDKVDLSKIVIHPSSKIFPINIYCKKVPANTCIENVNWKREMSSLLQISRRTFHLNFRISLCHSAEIRLASRKHPTRPLFKGRRLVEIQVQWKRKMQFHGKGEIQSHWKREIQFHWKREIQAYWKRAIQFHARMICSHTSTPVS